jgi:tetratricopeptide (TPR) repeat protein
LGRFVNRGGRGDEETVINLKGGYAKMYDEVIQAYDKAIEINPQYADALNNKDKALSHWPHHRSPK